jgi:AAA domain-containing protein
VQLFARAHKTLRDLPLRWFLNEGVLLPDDLERIRSTIEHYGFVMVVIDSVYNFTPELDLKDRDVGQLFARIKAEVCDVTGCTVVVVDHMPWGRRKTRAGSVRTGMCSRAQPPALASTSTRGVRSCGWRREETTSPASSGALPTGMQTRLSSDSSTRSVRRRPTIKSTRRCWPG